MINPMLIKLARSRLARMGVKRAFVPIDPAAAGAAPPGGGAPPMDPAMMGMPPGGAPPMDPAMMGMPPGGAPPMAPPMGMPPGGAPPMDPAMMGMPPAGAPPAGAPPINGQPIVVGLDDLIQLFMEVGSATGGAAAGGGEKPPASNEQEKPKGTAATKEDKLDTIIQNQEQLMSLLGAPTGGPSPAGGAGAMSDPSLATPIGQGVAAPAEGTTPAPEMPAPPAGMPPAGMPAGAPGMTVAASYNPLSPNKSRSINRVMSNLMKGGNNRR